ncbi:hypothetical protein [Pseudochelatococcus sp. G4_1912]|uniref:hypothetical protein n=1 Tax=Pseudochelatococcus sp. G4_1912 TaxID=3114288 RepID=UPI0039C6D679
MSDISVHKPVSTHREMDSLSSNNAAKEQRFFRFSNENISRSVAHLKMQTSNIAKLSKQISSLNKKIDQLTSTVESQRAEIQDLQRTVTIQKSEIQSLREEKASLAQKLEIGNTFSSSSTHSTKKTVSMQTSNRVSDDQKFPVSASPEEKLDFVVNLLKGKEGKFGKDYSWDEIKSICGKNISVPSGGGHGDVFFIAGTKYVLKQNLIDQEYSHYKFLHTIDNKIQQSEKPSSEEQSTNTPTRHRKRTVASSIKSTNTSTVLSQARLAKLAELRKSGTSAFRPPIEIGQGSNGKGFIVIQNALYNADNQPIAKGKTQIGEGHTNNLFDFKIGNKAAFNAEQIYAGARTEDDRVGLFLKKLRVLWNHVTNPSQGAALVGKDGISVDGKKLSTNGATSAKNTEKITSQRVKSLSDDQLKSIIDQLAHTVQEAKIMPVAFVGSSIVIGFPEDQNGTPQVMPIDYAHPVYESDITEEATNTKFGAKQGEISKEKYLKIKKNYVNGIQYLLNLFIKEQSTREIANSLEK